MHGTRKLAEPLTGRLVSPSARKRRAPLAALLLVLAVVTITVLGYRDVLFDFFVGDDFVHLTWLRQAIIHPELLLRNFYSSWLDGTTTKFYRPLISVFMFTDYLVGGANALMFHVTNLAFHVAGTAFLFLIVRQIGLFASEHAAENEHESISTIHLRSTVAATIFGLYPLHPEAVAWITGRVDSVVTAFCLAAIWTYLKWRSTARLEFLFVSLMASCLGLLSKEMAITLPAVFLCSELFLLSSKKPLLATGDQLQKAGILAAASRKIFSIVLPTMPFWALLGAYFVVRFFALGTMVGGYDNSLFFVANLREFALSWLHALRMFVEPINRLLLGSRDALTRGWEICLVASGISGALAMLLARRCRGQMLFALSWLLLSLVPVYKIFAISDDLQGSRLAYLATAPLSVLFAFACISWQRSKLNRWLGGALAVALCVLCFLILGINNKPWIAAGCEANAIRKGLDVLYSEKVSGDPQVLLIGLPDQTNGAYTCRNSLDGMTKKPQLHRDVLNCLMVNPFEPIFPFGYLKDSIAASSSEIKVFRWKSSSKEFEPVAIPAAAENPGWSADAPYMVVHPAGSHPAEVIPNSDGSVTVVSGPKSGEVDLNTGEHNCWSADFLQMELIVEQAPPQGRVGAELLYCNQLAEQFELKRRSHADVSATEPRTLTFALRGLPEWSFGGEFEKVRLIFPPMSKIRITEFKSVPASAIMPAIKFENSGYLGTKGYLHLSSVDKFKNLQFDCSRIAGAVSGELEITRANLLFEEQNSTKESAVRWKKIPLSTVSGTTQLSRTDFSSPGIYELRCRALRNDGSLAGVASDHIVISVDP